MDKYILPIAEDSFLTPEHFKNTFGTELFQLVPKEATGHATQQETREITCSIHRIFQASHARKMIGEQNPSPLDADGN